MELKQGMPQQHIKQGIPETKEKLSLKILVADDSESNRDMFQLVLESLGHKVKIVADGGFLLQELLDKGNDYDVVVSDNNMPIKMGIEVLKEIRAMDKLKRIPFVIATTDGTFDGSLERDITELGGLYLQKPFSIEQLSDAIDKVIKDKV